MKQVVVYPRGFAAYDVGWPILREEATLNERVAAARLTKINARETNTIGATNIENLYTNSKTLGYTNNAPELLEDVFSVFTNAFGTHNFFEWLTMQRQNPYFSKDHARFLMETLEYVFTGKRFTSFSSWYVLLHHGVAKAEQLELYSFERYFFDHARRFANVQELALKWMSHPDGISDMINTLHVIFGDQR